MQRSEYEESLKVYRDLNNVISTAKWQGREEGHAEGLEEGLAKGRAEGLEEGRVKGREEGIRAVALQMKQQGLPTAAIAQCTGLSQEEIERL